VNSLGNCIVFAFALKFRASEQEKHGAEERGRQRRRGDKSGGSAGHQRSRTQTMHDQRGCYHGHMAMNESKNRDPIGQNGAKLIHHAFAKNLKHR
jgi:hypothetical protein